MTSGLDAETDGIELQELHKKAEGMRKSFTYRKPELKGFKGYARLGHAESVRAEVQIVRKDGGENNLHYHSNGDSFWMVLAGRVRFYGPGNSVIGEFGPMEGTVTPAYARYWFENAGAEDLELLHVTALSSKLVRGTGYVDLQPERSMRTGPEDQFDLTR